MQNFIRGAIVFVFLVMTIWVVGAVPINKKTLAAHFLGSSTGRKLIKIYGKIRRVVKKFGKLFGLHQATPEPSPWRPSNAPGVVAKLRLQLRRLWGNLPYSEAIGSPMPSGHTGVG